jgi:hypothetical protein
MFRIAIYFVIFIGWILYRLLIKKDLKQNLQTLYIGLIFTAIWGIIYFLIFQF